MPKWEFVAQSIFDYKDYYGDILNKLSLNKYNDESEMPHILFIASGDWENLRGNWVSVNKYLNDLNKDSKELNFTFELLFKGRRYQNKIDIIPEYILQKRLYLSFKFIGPKWIIYPDDHNSRIWKKQSITEQKIESAVKCSAEALIRQDILSKDIEILSSNDLNLLIKDDSFSLDFLSN